MKTKNKKVLGVNMDIKGLKGWELSYLKKSAEYGHLLPRRGGKR